MSAAIETNTTPITSQLDQPIGIPGCALDDEVGEGLASSAATQETARESLYFSDLTHFGSSTELVRGMFEKRYEQVQPDGLALNGETQFNPPAHYTPPRQTIAQAYGHAAHKIMGPMVYEHHIRRGKEEELASRVIINDTDQEIEVTVTLEGLRNSTKKFELSGMPWKSKIPLQGTFHDGSRFAVEVQVNKALRVTSPIQHSLSLKVIVPPHSRRLVSLFGTPVTQALHARARVAAAGRVGANFPRKVKPNNDLPKDPAYFWFETLDRLAFMNAQPMHCAIAYNSHEVKVRAGEPTKLADSLHRPSQ